MNLLSLFRNAKETRIVPAGETIVREGEPGDVMYVLLEGEVDILARGRVINHLQPGDMFGELALIDSRPRSATAVAVTECKLAMVDQRRFMFLIQETPFFAIHVLDVLASRLRRQTDAESEGRPASKA
jgi:CRP-like cAMP-binding protein